MAEVEDSGKGYLWAATIVPGHILKGQTARWYGVCIASVHGARCILAALTGFWQAVSSLKNEVAQCSSLLKGVRSN